MGKLGRNHPCWCGSRKKYKKCHLNHDESVGQPPRHPANYSRSGPFDLPNAIARTRAAELRRESMQGKGKPIIAVDVNGYKVVAVGSSLHWSKSEKTLTFIDFLGNYIRSVLTPEWGNAEIAKPLEQRHPLLRWYDRLCRIQQEHYKDGEVFGVPATGLVVAYISLAYNLYLLGHNAEVQTHLIERLRDPNSFYAALYETHVAAWFILAGFTLALENESDPRTSHCEFTAHAPSGQRYSVEAKSRQAGKLHFAIGNQLASALKKVAGHPRIVCIDTNVRQEQITDERAFVRDIVSQLRAQEQKLVIKGQPAPPAFIFVSNMPHHLHLEEQRAKRALVMDGYKISDFGFKEFSSISDAYKARIKYADILSIEGAFKNYQVPSTFDGELPEFAFGEAERRFVIGDRHEMDDGVVGTLRQGSVLEQERVAYLIYETESGRQLIYSALLSDAEMRAYRQHPDTFFGRIERTGRTANTAIELYEFFFDAYRSTPRDKILEFLAASPDIVALRELSTEELRFILAERNTLRAIGDREMPDLRRKPAGSE